MMTVNNCNWHVLLLPISHCICLHCCRALLFPAVDPHHRYLIHSTVQDHFPALTSVSVGEGDQRRTAISFRSAPSPPDSPLVGHLHSREEEHRPAGPPHHDLDRRKECMQSPTQPRKQEEQLQVQHITQKQQQQQQQAQHNTQKQQQVKAQSTIEKTQNKLQQEAFRSAEAPQRRGSEKQQRKEEEPQQKQAQQPRQAPRFRSHSSSNSQSRQRRWRGSVSPQHRTAPPDSTLDTSSQQGKATSEETHSKRRRNRKNRRQKDKTEQPQLDKTSDHVNGKENQRKQNTESGQSRQIETVTVRGQGKVNDNPNGAVPARVTRRAEWTSSASASEGGIRKKCKSVEASGILRNNTRSQGNTDAGSSEECESRSAYAELCFCFLYFLAAFYVCLLRFVLIFSYLIIYHFKIT